MQILDDGWDSRAHLVDELWLQRTPRRPEVAPRLLMEAELLPWLAPQLPLPVPRPEVVSHAPLLVRHRLLVGDPATTLSPEQGARLGSFLRALHRVDAGAAVRRGAPDAESALREYADIRERCHAEVLPRLEPRLRERGGGLLARLARPVGSPALVHGDVGPAHVRVDGGAITGVIDWSDAHVGDPALDLAWAVCGSGAGDAVAEAYGADEELRARVRDWHRFGPWHEVLHGLDTAQPALVTSGLNGVRARLAR